MKTALAAGMAGLMMVTGLPVGTAQAGQREWATAGKILTGVVVGGVLMNACKARTAETEVVYERPVVYRYCTVERFHGPPRCEPPVMRACPPPPPPPPPPRCVREPAPREPIVRYLDDGRRLYQPPVLGHKAFIQVWSEVKNEWVSIKEHPSIW
jgi:hypothetical protein